MTKTPFDPDESLHPDTYKVPNGRQAFYQCIASSAAKWAADGKTLDTTADWQALANVALNSLKGTHREGRLKIVAEVEDKAVRKALREELEQWTTQMKAGHDELARKLRSIAKSPESQQRASLGRLREWAEQNAENWGEVGGDKLGPPDWELITMEEGARELMLASSEQTVLRLGEAYERGRFTVPPHGTFPMADISGGIGANDFSVHAELGNLQNEILTADQQHILRELADDLADVRKALGPRAQQVMEALMALWVSRRNENGEVVVRLAQLAEILGFEKRANGSYSASDYKTIREAIETLERTRINARPNQQDKKRPQMSYQEPAFTIGRTTEGSEWVNITFRPNVFFARAATRKGALLMGVNTEVNRLHPVNERPELLLGKYLDRHFRMNWNNEPGLVRRRARELISAGMGVDAEAPATATLTKLINSLEKLQGIGQVLEWEMETPGIDEALDYTSQPGRRMKRLLWENAMETMIRIEASKDHREHYRNFGLLSKQEGRRPLTETAAELSAYLRSTGRSQSVVAQELQISTSQMSRYLTGKSTMPAKVQERVQKLLQRESTLQLPLG